MTLRLALLAVLVILLPACWFILDYSKTSVIDEMIVASQKKDVAALSARVGWESLRAFLKEDIAAQKKTPIGASLGPDAGKIDAVVDYYVQPENIDILYYWHDEVFAGIPERDFILAEGFEPPFGFYATIGYPQNVTSKEPLAAAARDRLKARVVFRLDGMTWKIKEMRVPLFMVPRHVYSTPAVQVYGRPGK